MKKANDVLVMRISYNRGSRERELTVEVPDDLVDEFREVSGNCLQGDELQSSSRQLIRFLSGLIESRDDVRIFLGRRQIKPSEIDLVDMHVTVESMSTSVFAA